MNYAHTERLAFLDKYKETAWKRDDLYLEYATLLNQLERYQEAIEMIDSRKFHPWEGGEGKVPAQYQLARMELAKQFLKEQKYDNALQLIDECYIYPYNLGEGKLAGAQENDFNYYKGCVLERLGKTEVAREYFEKAAEGNNEPVAAMYYNDTKPDKIYYQGLALQKSWKDDDAKKCFDTLMSYGEKHLSDKFKMDYLRYHYPTCKYGRMIWIKKIGYIVIT